MARCKFSKDRTHYYRPLKQNAEPFTVMELFRGQGVINFLANKEAFANMVWKLEPKSVPRLFLRKVRL